MYSITIYSDDGTIAGNVEDRRDSNFISYVARIWDVRHWERSDNSRLPPLVEAKSFGNGIAAENWMLDKLECPLFTLLAK